MGETTGELVRRAIDGDALAFAALVEKYQGMVCGLALNSVGCFAEAEDIAQDAFVDAYRNLKSLRDPDKFAGWLRAIAVNKIRTWLRKHTASRERITDMSARQNSADECVHTDRPDDASLRESVLRAIEGLPENQRQAITLFYMDGQSYADIADFMDVPVTTVKARMQGGRRRLKKEMMTMVETVLDAEKPGRELAVRILRKAVGQAKQARKNRDYKSLLEYCDKAMGALKQLPETPKRRTTEMDVLHWSGETRERWLASPGEAITCYQSALEIATEMGDADGQARAMKAILTTHGRAGNFKAMKTAAGKGIELGRADSNEELLAFATAARDLCDTPDLQYDQTSAGGFVLSRVRLWHARGKWSVEQPCMGEEEGRKANVSLNVRWGTPARPTLFCYLFGPRQLIVEKPKVGDRWRGQFGNDMRQKVIPIDEAFLAESEVAADDESITVPAGRFRNCLKIETTIRATDRTLKICDQERFTLRKLSGKRWMWFARGVGLVRMLNVDLHDAVTDVMLMARHQKENGAGAYLPLATGNWWRYEWIERLYPHAVLTETCRVVRSSKHRAIISCALHSKKLDEVNDHEHGKRTAELLQRSSDSHLVAKSLFDRAGFDPRRLRRAAGTLARMGEAKLQADALFRLAWHYEGADQRGKALHTWEEVLQALDAPENAWGRASLSFDVAGACFRLNDYAKMFQVATEAERVFLELGDKKNLADMAGLADVAGWLSREGQPERVRGYSHGAAEVVVTPSTLESGNRAGGSCAPMSDARDGFGPICLGMERLLVLPARVGKCWTGSWNTGTARGGKVSPVVTRTIEARNDTADVPAGQFKKCLRVRAEIRTAPSAGGGQPEPKWQGYNDGVRLDWYAPGAGLVQVDFRHANGRITRVGLADYKVRAAGQSLLPNRLGNTWQYEWRDGRGKLLLREFWRVAAKKGKITYIGFGAFEYK